MRSSEHRHARAPARGQGDQGPRATAGRAAGRGLAVATGAGTRDRHGGGSGGVGGGGDDDTDVQELLSALSSVGASETPTRSKNPSDPVSSGLSAASEFAMSDVLSPETTRRLYEVTGQGGGRSSGRKRLPLETKKDALPAPPSTHGTRTASRRGGANISTSFASSISSASGPSAASTSRSTKSMTGALQEKAGGAILPRLDVADDKEIDARLAQDPCVLCFEDKVVLRSHRGTCISVARPKRKGQTNLNASMIDGLELALGSAARPLQHQFQPPRASFKNRTGSIDTNLSSLVGQTQNQRSEFVARVDGNPTEPACEFAIIGTAMRTHTGIVKHGDVVALISKARGRFLGVMNRDQENADDCTFDSDEEDDFDDLTDVADAAERDAYEPQWYVSPRRKVAGRREHWVVVEIENETTDRAAERQQRIAAAAARMGRRAEELGYTRAQLAPPSKREVTVSLRSSDAVLLRSVHAESLFLGVTSSGSLRLFRAPPANGACAWSLVKCPAPFVPLWSRQRPLLNAGALHESEEESKAGGRAQAQAVDKLAVGDEAARPEKDEPPSEGELVDAVLFAMQGLESDLIECTPGPDGTTSTWTVVEERVSDRALEQLSSRVMPLCSDYEAASSFVQRRSRPEFGRVSHAMAAAMRALLREYDVLVAQLEHQNSERRLSLQKLWFYVQPSMRVLQVLANVARKSEAATGGVLLNLVHDLASRGGDAKARSVYHYLVQHATVPYLEMLELWIYHGVIRDPYNEFMVYVDEDATKRTLRDDFNARYWDSRYTLRENVRGVSWRTQVHGAATEGTPAAQSAAAASHNHVPFFLGRLADKILTTGKYLNVVRECGRWVENTCAERIPYSDESHAYDQIVSRAHDFASRTLLNLLLQEEKLFARLRSLKHYFLLDQGDFFVHFMDLAHAELQKPVEQIAISRLQSLLDVCLRVRNVNDPFQEDLACELVPYALIEHVEAIHEFASTGAAPSSNLLRAGVKPTSGLHGIDAFTLDFKVRWPLSLVLSRQALTKYQLIFRHLFFCKHVERQLCTTWLAHQTTKELNLRSALGPDYCLRQRMLHFLQNFEYYVMFEVLEPRWHELEKRLEHVKTVDELMKHHSEFLDTCLRECLLTHQGLLKTLAKLMTTCLLFAEQIGRFANQLQVDESSMTAALAEQGGGAGSKAGPGPGRPGKQSASSSEAAAAAAAAKKRALRKTRIKVQEQHIRRIVTQDSYQQMILRSQETFDGMLSQFMDELLKEATQGEYHSHLTNLCTRLDFNAFYQK
ncbi:Gamma-tubulin complex component 2 [Hondaea fermentalgiana]|uniref:Gamma-tubulin complex component 2 n=1 Tax=Hondaea fermentalgiana TaxID=2315210 RepID=A0A2R5GGM5_9STRA|nr:Gamma-tubulin complex component 2 [Hondaea fermentalgiana]|eukprot:GBG30056.1 Gamma-tubulin complex component 2 [Hondaea fermentalgiana]